MEGKDTKTPEEEKVTRKRTRRRESHERMQKSTAWTLREYGGKPLWDWMGLLVVPFMLALITVLFTVLQEIRQDQIEDRRAANALKVEEQRAQDVALQDYLDQMGSLLLNEDRPLRQSKEGDEERTLARARTVTVLGRMDPSRKGQIVQFLSEAGLVQRVEGEPIITLDELNLKGADLEGADLSGADLSGANLDDTDLRGANLSDTDLSDISLSKADLREADVHNADLSGAWLFRADLRGANLRGADLGGADLSLADLSGLYLGDTDLTFALLWDADLSGADLSGADLEGANLRFADLRDADLRDANLSGANLRDADLRDANLSGANLSDARGITKEQLEKQTEKLNGATMPDGSKHP